MGAFTADHVKQFDKKYPSVASAYTPKPTAPSGLRGAVLNFLPTIAGGAGAAVGTLAGPGGTLAGGSVGSGLGEFLRQKLTGEAQDGFDFGNVAQETAFGALPGAMKGIKTLRSGGKAAQTTEAAYQARKGARTAEKAAGFVERTADRFKGAATGIKPGAKVGSRTLTVKRSRELNEHITKTVGAKPTDAADTILQRNEQFIEETSKTLDDKIAQGNRPMVIDDYKKVVDGVEKPVGKKLKGHPVHQELVNDFAQVNDLQSAEKMRRKVDDGINFSRAEASTDPDAERIYKAWRKSLDKFITEELPDTKPLKTALSRAFDTKTFIEPAARNPGGVGWGGIKAFGRAMQGGKRAVGTALEKLPTAIAGGADVPGFHPFIKTAAASVPQAGYRAAGSTVFGMPFVGDKKPEDTTPQPAVSTEELAALGGEEEATTDSSILAPDNIAANADKLLQSGATPDEVMKYLTVAEKRNKLTAGSSKKLNSAASGVVADTTTGLRSLQQLYGEIGESSANNPLIGRVRGSNPLDTNAQELKAKIATVKQIVGKALEGGVLRKEDEVKYARLLPTMGDTDAVAQAKIESLYDLISGRLNEFTGALGAGDGGFDVSALVGAGNE